jgi:hypothetical protein
MYYQYSSDFFQEIEERMRRIEEENIKIKNENNKIKGEYQQIKEENDEIKEKFKNIKPINIENINYKIQELVVKELKGTLNIGMTGISDPKELSKWLAQENDDPQEMKEEFQQEIQLEDIQHTNEREC